MNRLSFKGGKSAQIDDIYHMKPNLIIVLGTLLQFCKEHSLPCKITNVRQKFKESISNTHPQGRAFDMSVRNWSQENIDECLKYMFLEVGALGAISKRSKKKVVALHHDTGLGDHVHFQVRR